MLYHSPLKHFVKGLLGRKNDAWYFDRMIAAYTQPQQQLTQQALLQASQLATETDEALLAQPLPAQARLHPLYQPAMQLRQQLLQQQADTQPLKGWQVLIQLPPDAFSPGWASWFGSLGEAMQQMGAHVQWVWDIWTAELVGHADLILSQANTSFVQHWPAQIPAWLKPNALFACYCSFEQNDAQAATQLYTQLRQQGVNLLLNAADAAYIHQSPHSSWAQAAAGLRIASLPFGANPLRHYPAPWLMPAADYVFLGSANYDKAKRYHDFFYPLMQRYNGIIAGQGWPWSDNFILRPLLDRWMYSQAKVCLNLHLDFQIASANEMNERTYILFGCGAIQILDNPKLLEKHFPFFEYSCSNEHEYELLINKVITHPEKHFAHTLMALEHTYIHHTVFNRVNELLAAITYID
jgi:hypothetical protein